jgi:predicted DNA-binding transcriptional regulator YafY
LPSKDTQTDKMLEMVGYMREHPHLHKITDLAARYKTHRATIDRWCKSLEKRYGVVIEKTNSDFVDKADGANFIPRGYIKLSPDSPEVLNISLTTIELDALMIAAERIKPLTPLVKQAISKLSKAKRIKGYKEQASVLHTPVYDEYASDPSEILERVIEAIRDHHIAEVRYLNSKNQTTAYKFNSYALVPYHQHLYLIGVSHPSIESGDNTIIRLRLDQIKEFKLTRDHFDNPDFDVVAYAAQDFGVFSGAGKPATIKVRFSAEKAQYIRRTKRHTTQKVTDEKDGSVIWSIRAPLSDDLVYWIVSYGPHAKVLQPKELKKRVLEWAQGSVTVNET